MEKPASFAGFFNSAMTPFTQEVIKIIQSVPAGKVASYGQIARMAGNPRAARQVSRILHSCTQKYKLPWHRVVNSQGQISLSGESNEKQRWLLETEGVEFGIGGRIDMKEYGL